MLVDHREIAVTAAAALAPDRSVVVQPGQEDAYGGVGQSPVENRPH
jgi:hypothetical protein